MPTIYLDADTRNKFSEACQMTELRDENGKLIGHFVPTDPPCPWEPDLTEEEIQRRIREPGASSLADFWRKQGSP